MSPFFSFNFKLNFDSGIDFDSERAMEWFERLMNRTLVSLSTPLIKQITFLNTPFYRYGAFGYCPVEGECVHATGYSTGPEIREWMTETTALFPVGTSPLSS